MIGWLSGRIVESHQPGRLVLNVNGVGYDVETSLSTFFRLTAVEGVVEIYVHTVVREDAFLLYGFYDLNERALFRALIKVNGVGPKLAIGILSSVSPDEFIRIIQQQNPNLLIRLPGVGKKTAERLVVEMKDSITNLHYSTTNQTFENDKAMVAATPARYQDEAIQALEALGYKLSEATKIVRQLDDGQMNCEQLIRKALQHLSGSHVY